MTRLGWPVPPLHPRFAAEKQRVIYPAGLSRAGAAIFSRDKAAVPVDTIRGPRVNRSNCHVDAVCGFPVYTFTPPRRNSLTHIPGDEGWPLIGKTLDVLADPKGQVERSSAKYGLVYRSHLFGETSLVLLGPDANELVMFDQAKQFSSTLGWGRILGLLFPRGLMLLDFEEHRLHRRALSVAFKSGPMKSYLAELDTGIAARVAQWKAKPGPMLFYPAMKQLTLDLAATSFLGAGIGPEVDEITNAFVDMVAASVAVIRKPLPGTPMARGVRAASASSPISPNRSRSAAPRAAATICSRSFAMPPTKTAPCSRRRTSSIT